MNHMCQFTNDMKKEIRIKVYVFWVIFSSDRMMMMNERRERNEMIKVTTASLSVSIISIMILKMSLVELVYSVLELISKIENY